MCVDPRWVHVRPSGSPGYLQQVKCGKCLECAKLYSIEWSFRIMDECSLHSQNCFLTLTYNNENLPLDGSVSHREVQLFMKSLRKKLHPLKIRFFACGEYGKRLGRPHYHLIIFGWFPEDAYFFQYDGKSELFRSPLLEEVWQKGFSSVGKVTTDTALYTAKYMNKYAYENFGGKESGKTPPFVQMSNRPGIGYGCVYNVDLLGDRLYRDGRSCKIPRYYLKVMDRDGVFLDDFKQRRQRDGEHKAAYIDLDDRRRKLREFYSKTIVSKPSNLRSNGKKSPPL